MTTNASLTRTGAVLSVGKFWGKAQLIAFDSSKYILAKHNYPVHKQEMLTIIHVKDESSRLNLFSCSFLFSFFI